MSNVGSYNPNAPRGGNRQKTKRVDVKANSTLTVAVLPPFKSLKDKNSIAYYWSIIWMVDSRGGKKPVPSLEKKRQGKVVTADPILEKVAAMKAMSENSQGKENPEVLKQLNEKLSSLDPDKGYHLNVITPAGEIAVLKLRYTAFQALEERLKELDKKGINAIAEGLFFDVKRWKDEKGKTHYGVDVATEHRRNPQTGAVELSYRMSKLDDMVIARMETEAQDLSTLYTVRSMEEQAALASLDPAIVSRIFMRGQDVEAAEAPSAEAEPEGNGAAGSFQGYTGAAQQMPQQMTTVTPTPPQTQMQQQAPVQNQGNTVQSQFVQAPNAAPVGNGGTAPTAPVASGLPDDVKKFLFNNPPGGKTN